MEIVLCYQMAKLQGEKNDIRYISFRSPCHDRVDSMKQLKITVIYTFTEQLKIMAINVIK